MTAPNPGEVTAETITDDQLRELETELYHDTVRGRRWLYTITAALAPTIPPRDFVVAWDGELPALQRAARKRRLARERCAAAWNARHGGL